MTDEEVMDDDPAAEVEPEDERTAVRRKARELLASLTPTAEDLAEREARRMRIRDAEFAADAQRRALERNYQERKAPIAEAEARQEADRLDRVVEAPAPLIFSEAQKQVIGAVAAKLQQRYSDALEKALGQMLAELRTRHAAGEQRTTTVEGRLAALEGRLAVLEAKGVSQPEKQAASDP